MLDQESWGKMVGAAEAGRAVKEALGAERVEVDGEDEVGGSGGQMRQGSDGAMVDEDVVMENGVVVGDAEDGSSLQKPAAHVEMSNRRSSRSSNKGEKATNKMAKTNATDTPVDPATAIVKAHMKALLANIPTQQQQQQATEKPTKKPALVPQKRKYVVAGADDEVDISATVMRAASFGLRGKK